MSWRTDLIASMSPDEMGTLLALTAGGQPEAFDAAFDALAGSLAERFRQARQAAGVEPDKPAAVRRTGGTVTEWALAYTHRPNIPGQPDRRVIQPYPGEAEAREAVAELLQLAPGDEPALMSREIGPWKEAPDA